MKRFISGAQCQNCQELDSVYFNANNKDKIYCIRCDYEGSRPQASNSHEDFSDKILYKQQDSEKNPIKMMKQSKSKQLNGTGATSNYYGLMERAYD